MKKEMDPLVAAPNNYKLLFENDRVRVLEAVFKPGEIAKMHHHPDHVAYALTDGKGRRTSGGKVKETDIKTGSVFFIEAQDNEFENIGKTTYRSIVVELKK
jgi:quercetin dioxygenase-like cupin family protein